MNVFARKIISISIIGLLFCVASPLLATEHLPKISIIIDDLGYDENAGLRVAQLPGQVVCSILPRVQFSLMLATRCHAEHKEIILHMPMEALTPHRLGPGGLYMSMNKSDFMTTLNSNIKAVPYIIGLNNHEGSRLTASTLQMDWLMQTINSQGLFYVDSVTSAHSVAEKLARQRGVPSSHRDVFLDDVPTQAAVRAQLNELLAEADAKGHAVAIGHPYRATLTVLEQELSKMMQKGYELVPISALVSQTATANIHPANALVDPIEQAITVTQVGFAQLPSIQELPRQSPTAHVVNNKANMAAVDKKSVPIESVNRMLHDYFCHNYTDLCQLLPSS